MIEYNRRLVEEMKKKYNNDGQDEDNDAKLVMYLILGISVIIAILFILMVIR